MLNTIESDQTYCERCKRPITDDCVWLELSWRTGKYHLEGTIEAEESQGFFPFGRACSKTVLKNKGNKYV